MRLLARLYEHALDLARHIHAPKYLGFFSFIEAIFFPIPPDVMLAPMVLAAPRRAYHFAFITTATSLLGGMTGYALSYYAFDILVNPLIQSLGYQSLLGDLRFWFDNWGSYAILLAAFTFIPYKVITCFAGMMHFSFPLFIASSLFGRGARFYLVASLIRAGGAKMEDRIKQLIDKIGWMIIIITVSCISYVCYR